MNAGAMSMPRKWLLIKKSLWSLPRYYALYESQAFARPMARRRSCDSQGSNH
jgi:hypothetical protein